jgi:hypothetical protein
VAPLISILLASDKLAVDCVPDASLLLQSIKLRLEVLLTGIAENLPKNSVKPYYFNCIEFI